MSIEPRQQTGTENGRLWGARAQDWAELQEVQVRPAYEAVFDLLRIKPGILYCDVGCGSGLALQLAAARGAQVAGLDAAVELLSIAGARVPEADLRVGELQDLPFEPERFDVVTGFNSFQYAADPVAALAEAKRITKPGGHVVVMTWGPPQGMQAASLVAALKPLLPAPPSGAPGPFALSDADALNALASSAGLHPLSVHDVRCTWEYRELEEAVRAFGSAGVAVRAAEHSGQEAVDRAHVEALAPFRQSDGSYRLEASFRWLLARK